MALEALLALPLFFLAGGSGASFLAGRALRSRSDLASSMVAMTSLGLAFAAFLYLRGIAGDTPPSLSVGEASLRADGLGMFLAIAATGLGFAVAVYSIAYMRGVRNLPSYSALLLLLITGIVGIGLAGDLFNLYVFFELMALSSYALVAFHRERSEAVEAGMKYLVMSAAGSLVALLGIGLLYASTGTLDLSLLSSQPIPQESALLSAGLLIAGFGVKAAIVPMHTWLPDAHSAAPTGISAMLSGIVIQSGLLAMVRSLSVFGVATSATFSYGLLLAFLAVLTMTVGNLTAMQQRDIKRLLAYSSIAQMGYILLGFGIGLEFGLTFALVGGTLHILNHAIMKGGAFLAAGMLQRSFGTRDLDALRGAGRSMPVAGLSFALFALALAGVPPTAGFLSKLYIAIGAVQAGGALGIFFVVALIANSVLSLAYYVPTLTGLMARAGPPSGEKGTSLLLAGPLFVLSVLVLLLGLWPDLGLGVTAPAAESLLKGSGGG